MTVKKYKCKLDCESDKNTSFLDYNIYVQQKLNFTFLWGSVDLNTIRSESKMEEI